MRTILYIVVLKSILFTSSFAQNNKGCLNNSDLLSLDQLSVCIEKHIDSSEIRSVFKLLGNDSSYFRSKNHLTVNYFCDKITFSFDKLVLKEIQLTDLFKSKSRFFETLGRNRSQIEQKIGIPTKEEIFNCVSFTDDGKETEKPCNFECYYSNHNLKILYDLNGNVEMVTLSPKE